MKYKQAIGLLLLVCLTVIEAGAQVYERSRKETQTFKVFENTSLEVYNKYGNIQLLTWDKDSVKIDIDLSVKASKESKAEKIFEFIDFEFSDSRYYLVVRTRFRENQGSFWAELSDLANTVFSGNNKAQIDYTIHLPSNVPVKLENKFGNIYATDHAGPFEVLLSNGDLKVHHLTGEVSLDLGFGNADIQYLEYGKITSNYVELDLGSAKELAIESKSGEFKIQKVEVLKLNSRRDKFKIEELTFLSGTSSFSFLTIKQVHKSIRLESDYGELDVAGIDPSFQKIEFRAKFTDFIFQISPQLNTTVQIEHSSTTGIYYPDSMTGLETTPAEKDEGPGFTNGILGKKESLKGKIEMTIQSGNVTFQEEIQLF